MRIIRPVKVTKDGTFTRSSTGTYWDKNGVLQTAAANTLRITYDHMNLKKAPHALIEPATTNLALNSDVGTTQTITTTQSNYALSFEGTGSVTLSGSATGTLQGIDNGVCRMKAVFPATAGAVTLTVTGAVTRLQFEAGNKATSYYPSGATPATRAADVVGGTGLIYSSVPETEYPAWSATKLYAQGDRVIDLPSHKVYESVNGLNGTATFLASATGISTPTVLLKRADGTAAVPAVNSLVVFSGSPPSGVTPGVAYYVLAIYNGTDSKAVPITTFSISLLPSGTTGAAAITFATQATPVPILYSPNYNIPVTNTAQWLDAGYDNRWDMFDDSITSQTSLAGDVAIVVNPGARLDSIAAFNLAASSISVSFTDITTGDVLYRAVSNLVSDSNIQDLYSYLYEPIVSASECLVDRIPLGISSSSVITVVFRSGGTTNVGGVIFGVEKDIGYTEWGTKIGIIDYSVKTKDNFGNYTITPRAFSKRGDFSVQVPSAQVDYLQSLLAQFRATPIVYIGSNSGNRTQFNSTMIYGFYKDFDINIAYNAFSVCSITVEGLT